MDGLEAIWIDWQGIDKPILPAKPRVLYHGYLFVEHSFAPESPNNFMPSEEGIDFPKSYSVHHSVPAVHRLLQARTHLKIFPKDKE